MSKIKKILVFSPPFSGHLNVLRDLVKTEGDLEWKLVITGWTNIEPVLAGLEDRTLILAESELHETDPALWTFPRLNELLESSLIAAKDFKPDLIIYDFFSIEGKLVSDMLKIPSWSSIPAFVGSYTNKDYLVRKFNDPINQRAFGELNDRFDITFSIDDFEMVSDGLHLPAEINLVWSYTSVLPSDYRSNRHDKSYLAIGSSLELSPDLPAVSKKSSPRPTIYVSFGTVVLNNLWNQQDRLKTRFTAFINDLANMWASRPWDIVFVTQGKKILDRYPKNWMIIDTADQVTELGKSDVFVTHGGSNSFHESLKTCTPMAVIPFFGDQPLVALRVDELSIGTNLVPGASIDTRSPKDFLNRDLVRSLDDAVQSILVNDSYKTKIKDLSLNHTNVLKLIEGKIDFQEGDLLFGTNAARKKYVEENDLQDEFSILEFKAFSELAAHKNSLPRIVDIYHDVILSNDYYNLDSSSEMTTYIKHLQAYKEYLNGEKDFMKMCIKGLDYFSQFYKINFILSDYDPAVNLITKAEIRHILNDKEKFKDVVTFYEKTGHAWIPLNFSEVERKYL